MGKVVFSFDDGLLDFYEYVFPILKKYNIKATLNVATGLVDGTVNDGFEYCTIDQIKEMSSCGVEMAIHSNYHSKNTTVEDLAVAKSKLGEWIGNQNIHGVVIPYNIMPSNDIFNWMKENKLEYLRGDEVSKIRFHHKILFKLRLLKRSTLFAKQSSKIYKINGVKYVPCIAVYPERNENYFIKYFKKMHKNHSLTLMFHSVLPTKEDIEKCPYPRGAWLVEQFENLIKWLLENDYQICTQHEIF